MPWKLNRILDKMPDPDTHKMFPDMQRMVDVIGALFCTIDGACVAEPLRPRLHPPAEHKRLLPLLRGKQVSVILKYFITFTSVTDPGCLSRIPDPDFYLSRILQQHQKRRENFFFLYQFLLPQIS
jgi:hypothetical protein